MTLGNKIKLLRLKKGVTQEMVAQEFHMSSLIMPESIPFSRTPGIIAWQATATRSAATSGTACTKTRIWKTCSGCWKRRKARQVLALYRALPDHKEYLIYKYEAKIALAEHLPNLAQEKMDEMEQQFPDDSNVLFEEAGFYASTCQYEKAITYYEKSWDAGEKPRYYDALQGEALIYEIQGKQEQALHCWDRIRENLEQEWGVTEGTPLKMVKDEKERILNSMK